MHALKITVDTRLAYGQLIPLGLNLWLIFDKVCPEFPKFGLSESAQVETIYHGGIIVGH